MRVAGRELVQPFDAFWERFGPEIPVPVEYTEKGTPWFYTWPESTEGRPWGQPLKKLEGAPLNLG